MIPVKTHSFSEDLVVEVIQCSKQSQRALSVIFVSACGNVPLAQGQFKLGSFHSLALALFAAAEDGRTGRRIQIRPDDILGLGLKLGVLESLKVQLQCGLRSLAAQIRCIAERNIPLCRALIWQLNRARPLGLRTTSLRTLSTLSVGSVFGLPVRGDS